MLHRKTKNRWNIFEKDRLVSQLSENVKLIRGQPPPLNCSKGRGTPQRT